jgi:TonB family protein
MRALLGMMLLACCAESRPPPRPTTLAAPPEPESPVGPREGTATPEEYAAIDDAMHRKMEVLHNCYEQEMAKRMDRSFQGKVTVELRVGRDGRPISVDILEDTLKAPVVNQCLVETIRKFEFGALTGEVRIDYPIAFAPQY